MGIIMSRKISSNTVLYTMRIVGVIIMLAALALIAYLAWITSQVGLDGFLISAFIIGIVSIVAAVSMIYFSFRITFEEETPMDMKVIHRKEKEHILSKKCS